MKKRFETLDSFRGLAALFVVIHHMHYVGSITELNFFKHSFWFVEFFFVLSGFVLAHGYAWKQNLKFKNYFIARTFRIFPLHLFILCVYILFELIKLFAYKSGLHINAVPFSNNNAISEIIPNALLLQSWLPHASHISFNAPSWSISVEYYMYMIFFVTLLLKKNMKYITWLLISVSMFILLIMDRDLAELIVRGLSCFFAGVLTYLIYINIEQKVPENVEYWTLLEIMLLSLVSYLISSDFIYKSLVISLLFCMVVLVFAFEKGLISSLLKQKVFLYLGKLSYSIYMIHAFIVFNVLWFFIIIDRYVDIKLTPVLHNIPYVDFGSPLYNNIFIVVILGIIVFISGFTYRFIEKKGQQLGKKYKDFI